MAKIKKVVPKKPEGTKNEAAHVSSSFDDLLIAAAASGSSNLETGRFIVTLKEAAGEKGLESLSAQGMRMADARDFKTSAVEMETLGDADGLYFNEIGCAVISGAAAKERSMGVQMELSSDSAIATIEPEYFAFASGDSAEFLRGFLRATEVISKEIGNFGNEEETDEDESREELKTAEEKNGEEVGKTLEERAEEETTEELTVELADELTEELTVELTDEEK